MSRSPRFLPKNKDGVLVEVSSRTVNAWALLRPSAELSDITVGVLGRSLEISPVEVVALSFLSNHHHREGRRLESTRLEKRRAP